MVDVIFRAAKASKLIIRWRHTRAHITALFDDSGPPSLNYAIALMPPFISQFFCLDTRNRVARWAAAVSTVSPSEEVCLSVVYRLLNISHDDSLWSSIPVNVWAWLKKRPHFPPNCQARRDGSWGFVARHVGALGDVEILKSYFFLVWSEWNYVYGTDDMENSIRRYFGGMRMQRHRNDLIHRLDTIQGQLNRGLEYIKQHQPWVEEDDMETRKRDYERLKGALQEVDRETMEIAADNGTPLRSIVLNQRTY